MGGDGNALEPLVTSWYVATSGVSGGDPRRRVASDAHAYIDFTLQTRNLFL
jgi:hypothetical protein